MQIVLKNFQYGYSITYVYNYSSRPRHSFLLFETDEIYYLERREMKYKDIVKKLNHTHNDGYFNSHYSPETHGNLVLITNLRIRLSALVNVRTALPMPSHLEYVIIMNTTK